VAARHLRGARHLWSAVRHRYHASVMTIAKTCYVRAIFRHARRRAFALLSRRCHYALNASPAVLPEFSRLRRRDACSRAELYDVCDACADGHLCHTRAHGNICDAAHHDGNPLALARTVGSARSPADESTACRRARCCGARFRTPLRGLVELHGAIAATQIGDTIVCRLSKLRRSLPDGRGIHLCPCVTNCVVASRPVAPSASAIPPDQRNSRCREGDQYDHCMGCHVAVDCH
jgi:hypothetical protein